ncbi:MAG: four helix bundle protein, partial [Calditrichaeota bacterium]|nr:four helix bundle protein [Calditrichota bacterium]
RSVISVMANIAEGFERKSNKEFIQFLRYSVASAAETKSHLYIALDLSYIIQDQFDKSRDQIDVVSRQLKSFIKHLIKTKP